MPQNNTSKSSRVLELYSMLLKGQILRKQDLAEYYGVNSKSIQRDIELIRSFLADTALQQGLYQTIVYDSKEKGYKLTSEKNSYLSEGEMLAVCKILIESRAFSKEVVTSLLNTILNLTISPNSQKQIKDYIGNELFNYRDLTHPSINTNMLWEISEAIQKHKYVEVTYRRLKNEDVVKRKIMPVGIIFSEFYFYLLGDIGDKAKRDSFQKKEDPYPTIYRIDRIQALKVLDEQFSVEYSERFQTGQYKNRVQYMFGGEIQIIEFKYYGPSIEAVLDKLPMAEVIEEKEGYYTIRAETFGKGILMWLLSQGSNVEVIAPIDLKTAWLTESQKILEREGIKL